MSLTKLSLAGINVYSSRPGRVWLVTSRLGTGKTITSFYSVYNPVIIQPDAQFIIPDWGDKVDYGIGLPYRPVRLQAGGPVRQPYAIVDFIPYKIRDYEFGYCSQST